MSKQDHKQRGGSTPISQCRNLGFVSERELNSIGISSFEEMRELGWEQVCEKYISCYPERLNLNMITSIIGALFDQDWRKLDSDLKVQAKRFLKVLKERKGNK